jgi:transposase
VDEMKKDELKLKNSVLVMDNHSSHISKKVKELLLKEKVEVLFLPPYCSELNPIEMLWSQVKH